MEKEIEDAIKAEMEIEKEDAEAEMAIEKEIEEAKEKRRSNKTRNTNKKENIKKNKKNKKDNGNSNKGMFAIALLVLLVIVIAIASIFIKKYSPTKEVMDLKKYYKLSNDTEAVVVLQDKVSDLKGMVEGKTAYIDYDIVKNEINNKFYWDYNENILVYTTPTEIIKTEVGSKDYYTNRSKKTADNTIVKINGEKVYISLDFVEQFSDMNYRIVENPNRIIIDYKWDDYLKTNVKKHTQIRYRAGIKSPVLKQLKKGDKLTVLVEKGEVPKNFTKVLTDDGIIGYVKNNKIGQSYYEALKNKNNYEKPVYSSILKDYKINMVWHQVTNRTSNSSLLSLLDKTKGVTTVSPTWFSVNSNAGNISSLASEQYVESAHNMGVEVWGLVDDFDPKVKVSKLLSYTSKREKVVNELIVNAIKYNLDGLNIDFENIKKEYADSYIQFIRELSVKCRNNGIVLSVDNYVPTDYSLYYNRKEQGEIADYIITMAYDEHYSKSQTSGSVASCGYVKKAIDDMIKLVPKEKNIIGVPFYTRLWKETIKDGKKKVTSQSYSMEAGERLLANNGVKPKWDEKTKQYYGEFKEGNAIFKMWLEEEKSMEEKLKIIKKSNVAGVAGWKLGLEKENIWNVITKYIA